MTSLMNLLYSYTFRDLKDTQNRILNAGGNKIGNSALCLPLSLTFLHVPALQGDDGSFFQQPFVPLAKLFNTEALRSDVSGDYTAPVMLELLVSFMI